MVAKFSPDMPVMERVALIEEALAKALRRYPLEIDTDSAGDRILAVPGPSESLSGAWVDLPLFDIAREIERLLA